MFNGSDWEDFENMEDIEMAYCNPKNDIIKKAIPSSRPERNKIGRNLTINIKAMKANTKPARRLSTPSSVTQDPEYVLTTEWIWYWKDERGTWIEYGHPNISGTCASISSSYLEDVYSYNTSKNIMFTAGWQEYVLDLQVMKQRNTIFKTEREVRRRPKFLDFETVKKLRGSTKSDLANSLLWKLGIPTEWNKACTPHVGAMNVRIPEDSSEFSNIATMFLKTMSKYTVKKLWRVQNLTLWQSYQLQKNQMKRKNMDNEVDERQLFHGTNHVNIAAICKEGFDWRLHSTINSYGKGSYFARDASYSHGYTNKRIMFVALVLVGDFIRGDSSMGRPPRKPKSSQIYDSCVDNVDSPSIFVIFEKSQAYPQYILNYE